MYGEVIILDKLVVLPLLLLEAEVEVPLGVELTCSQVIECELGLDGRHQDFNCMLIELVPDLALVLT